MTESPNLHELAGYVSATPERFVPGLMAGTEIEAEHRARYRWIAPLAGERRVLDAGCGTGYGTRLLLDGGAIAVIGLDISEAAVRAAENAAPEASFVVGDVLSLPFANGAFDLVVAFELIEHVEPQEQALAELRRVLAPGGVLAISSPNRDMSVPGNPHHVKELVPEELERLLRERFLHVCLYQQQTWMASAILDASAAETNEARLPLAVWKTVQVRAGDELYTVALASDAHPPALEGVSYFAPTDQLRSWVERVASLELDVSNRDALLAERDAELADREAELAERDAVLYRREAQLAERDAEVLRLRVQQSQTRQHLRRLQATLSWRVTRPLRALRRLTPGRVRGTSDVGGTTGDDEGRPIPERAAVLYVSGGPEVSARYRCDHQAEQLLLLGGTATVARHGEVDLSAALDRHQLVVLHRVAWGDDVASLLERARAQGKSVVFDTDDLVFEPDALRDVAVLADLPAEEARLYVEGVHRYRETLERCSGATVSTEALAVRIRALGPPVVITPNVASVAMVTAADRLVGRAGDADPVVVGYMSGTNTHRKDFEVAARGLEEALGNRPRTELRIVGPLEVDGHLDTLSGRVTRLPLQPWSRLAGCQASIHVNLAPLEPDNSFTACKSAVKWLEAALVACPTVASRTPEFERVIRPGENGLLADSHEDWRDAVAALVDDARLRRELGRRAREDVLSAHTTKAQAPKYWQALRQLMPRSDGALVINWILYSPIPYNSGGYRNIFRIAHALGDRGHHQRLVVNPVAHLAGLSESAVHRYIDQVFGIPQHAEIVCGHDDIPGADVSLATYWRTAQTVAKHGRSLFKGYFIQDFEPEFHDPSDHEYLEAERTYVLPLRHICLGASLGQRLEDFSGLPSLVVDFALDPEFRMTRPPEERGQRPRLLFFARPTLRRRAYEVGIGALAEVKRRHPSCEIRFFGSSTSELGDVPFDFENLGVIDATEVARAMNEAHILLSFSLTNISNVPFEGMACGCAVVELDLPNVAAMTRPGENCLLARLEPSALADAVSVLIDSPALRIRLGRQGAGDMAGRTWQRTANMLEDALRELCFLSGARQDDDSRTTRPAPVRQN